MREGAFVTPSIRDSNAMDYRVSEFIDHQSMTWNMEILMDFFEKDAIDTILANPLGENTSDDTFFWG